MFKDKTILELLHIIQAKLANREIGFWIEDQDCYLWENTLHYTNKIKVGDLSLTKKNYIAKLIAEFEKLAKENEARKKFLNAKFSEISDVELIEELQKRVKNQTIKLSIYPQQKHIFIEAKDVKCGTIFPLPIERKEEHE